MHELPLCEAVVEQITRDTDGNRVRTVHVEIGALHHATSEAFQQLFTQAAVGTAAADATVELTQIPATFSCAGCGASGPVDARVPLCPSCNEPVRPIGGDELRVTAVDYVST